MIQKIKGGVYKKINTIFFYIFRLFPIKHKVVATTMRGRKYADNPRYIIEELHRICPNLDVVWMKDTSYNYELPPWIRTISYYHNILKKTYELTTAKVWINSHRIESYYRKRKGQVFIETWHGGLGIKKIEGDVERVANSSWQKDEINKTTDLADVFISNSEHLSNIYRKAFGYKGTIFKCGYPKNDIFFCINNIIINKVRKDLNIYKEKILLYAPTYRAFGEQDFSLFDIDYITLRNTLNKTFGGDWIIIVKWHPIMTHFRNLAHLPKGVIDVTEYNDIQNLLCAADIVISDYSSCIFDAALRGIPCFTYAKDFDSYKKEQGTYYEMEELPFPYAKNNEELIDNILHYNYEEYLKRWEEFKKKTGLVETGHAAKVIAAKIKDIFDGKYIKWEN